MIFNESNVKVICENGYLKKYVGKKAPYFPFTEDELKNNVIVLIDYSYNSRIFYLFQYYNNYAEFFAITGSGATRLSFDFKTMNIGSTNYNWGVVN